jgi:hypothetical protein
MSDASLMWRLNDDICMSPMKGCTKYALLISHSAEFFISVDDFVFAAVNQIRSAGDDNAQYRKRGALLTIGGNVKSAGI